MDRLNPRRVWIVAAIAAALLATVAPAAIAAAAGPEPTHTPTPLVPTQIPYPTAVPYPTQVPYPTPVPPRSQPVLLIAPTSGLTETAVTASGTHFPSGEITLYLDDTDHVLGHATIDDYGHARLGFTIPRDATTGAHEIRAVGAKGASGSALFTVTQPQGAVSGSGSGSVSYCTGLLGWCPDLGGLIGSVAGAIWGAITGGLNGKLHDLSTAILDPIVSTPDLRANQELTRVQGVLSQDATEAIAVLFGIAALWCAKPSFFGEIEQGVALLLRSGLVVATLRTLNPLLTTWTDIVNALATDVGHANIADTGHTGLTLVIAPILLLIAGLERAVSLYTFGLTYAVAPIFIVLAIWPPAHRLFMAWLFLFISTSTMGVAYSLATSMIVAMGVNTSGLWADVMTVGGLFFLTLVPVIWAGLTLATGQGSGGALSKVANMAKMALV